MTTFSGPPAETEVGIGALTVGGLLEETAARHGPREAIVFHEDGRVIRMSYDDLRSQARTLAKALMAAGVVKGARVALLMGNRPEGVVAAFGVAMAGGVLVPVSTFSEPAELDYILRHSDASVVLLQRQLAGHAYLDTLRQLCPEIGSSDPGRIQSVAFPNLRRVACLGLAATEGAVESWTTLLEGATPVSDELLDARASAVSPADDGLIIYTSGTSAAPKGVVHGHRAVALQSWRLAQLLRLDEESRSWSPMPFFWTAGFCLIMGASLASGGALVLQETFEPGEALRLIEAERVTRPQAWAHQLVQLEEHPDWATRDLSSVRQVESYLSFGRHKTVQLEDVWSSYSAYGMSETFTIISAIPADTPVAERDGHHGRILPGNLVRILDPVTGETLPGGRDGQIAVKGPTLMKGYLKVLPEDSFDADGFFRSGDSGFVDAEGRLHWTGRTSELIKTGGANVSPTEIEEVLVRHPALKVALAVGVPDPLLGERVVVCAVAHEGSTVAEEDVREFLRGQLASYKIPRRVLFFDEAELSLTGSGKIRGAPLRSLAIARLAAGRPTDEVPA